MSRGSTPTRLILVVDQPRRDLEPLIRLRDELLGSDSRYQVLLSGHIGLPWAVTVFQPHAVIFGKTESYPGDVLRAMSGGLVLTIHTEQNMLTKSQILIQFLHGHPNERLPNIDHVDYFLLANRAIYNALKGDIPEEKLVVVGSTRLLQEQYAVRPKRSSTAKAIGIAAGPNLPTQSDYHSYFRRYIDYPYKGTWGFGSIEEQISFWLSECAWLNHIYEHLADTDQLIVRPRFGGNNYFPERKNVDQDLHPSPRYLLGNSRVVIYGHSSLGVESLMFGVPAISIVKLIRLGSVSEKVASSDFTRHCWQPEDMDELMDLLEKSKSGDLALSPDISEYAKFVSTVYYNGESRDRSLANIRSFLDSRPLIECANLDYERYREYHPQSFRLRLVTRLLIATKSVRVYLAVMWYLSLRKRASRGEMIDSYISAPRLLDIVRGYPSEPSNA